MSDRLLHILHPGTGAAGVRLHYRRAVIRFLQCIVAVAVWYPAAAPAGTLGVGNGGPQSAQ